MAKITTRMSKGRKVGVITSGMTTPRKIGAGRRTLGKRGNSTGGG